jgi:RNA polymerase sigma factor (sigma-70 family)
LDFYEVYEQHYDRVRGFILATVKNRWVADHLVHETFLRVLKNFPKDGDPVELTSWILRIATNLCQDYFPNGSWEPIPFEDQAGELRAESFLEKEIERYQTSLLVQDLIKLLPEPVRQVSFLCDIRGESHQEAAEILGISLEDVKVRLHQARKQLKNLYLENAERRLCALLSADVEGYSRLMGEDELATIQTLQIYQGAIAAIIKQFRGRVVDSPGDNILAEFASVVDAVESAVTIQNELKIRNAELPENRRMKFRIGINVGDVIEDKGRLYGNGVNIAARIENLAAGGEICISGMVHDQVIRKLPIEYQYLGRKKVKNISRPLPVYRILTETQAGRINWRKLPVFRNLLNLLKKL